MRKEVSLLPLLFLLVFPPFARAQNLLKNSSFEQVRQGVLVDWIPKHSTTLFEATNSAVKQGSQSAAVSKLGSKTGWTYAYQDVAATPSAVYKLSGWVRWLVGAVSKAALKIDWLTVDGKRVPSKSSADEVGLDSPSDRFEYLEIVKTAPEETKTARIELFVNLKEGELEPSIFYDQLFFGEFTGELVDDDLPQFIFDLPKEVRAGEGFNISVSLSNYSSNEKYKVKFLAGTNRRFYDGRTQSVVDTFLAWNASWEDFPNIMTDAVGDASTNMVAMINFNAEQGDYQVKVRLRDSTGTNYDSNEKLLTVLPQLESESIDQEQISIMTVSEARRSKLGSKVFVSGVVTVPPGIFAEDQLYIRDRTGGILVKGRFSNDLHVALGNQVEVSCTLEEAWNEKYIKMGQEDSFAVIARNLPDPDPEIISTGEVGEDKEGQLVMTTGSVVETSGSTFYIDDSSKRAKVYIKKSTGIDVPRKKIGNLVSVTGIVSQWGFLKDGSANYRIMPRYQSDLQISVLEEQGAVLGISELPVTGDPAQNNKFFLDISAALICLGLGLRYFTVPESALANHEPN